MPRKPSTREVKKPERTKKGDKAEAVPIEKEKNVAEPKIKKVKKAAKVASKRSHPPYSSMIKKVLKANSPHLMSVYSIASFIRENYDVPENFKRYLRQALKRMEENEKTLIRTRASYRLSAKANKRRSRSRSKSPKRKSKKEEEKESPKKPRAKKEEKPKREKKVKEDAKEVAKEGEKPQRKRAASSEKAEKEKAEKPKKKRVSKKSATEEGGKGVAVSGSKYDNVWQFKDDHGGWKSYDVTASDTVEEVYQNYLSNRGDNDVRAVHSGQWEYMVDFMAMKQTNIQHPNHTVRDLRRVPVTSSTSS